uniref:Conotoxin n=1 Tax=Conus betulinus TaxID=89764 RepID=A0A1P7ZCP9_CONBE|nr:Conotoxin [Conus betulinus]
MPGSGVALLAFLLLLSLVTNLQGGGEGQTMYQDKHRQTMRKLSTLGRKLKRNDPCELDSPVGDDCTGTQICCTPPGSLSGECKETSECQLGRR